MYGTVHTEETGEQQAAIHAGLPPGPRLPAALQGLLYLTDGERFIDYCLDRYGDIFTLKIIGLGRIVAISNPEHVKQVFKAAPNLLEAGSGNKPIEILLGSRSLLVLDGSEHLRQRKLLLPPFHGERLALYKNLIDELTEDALDRWPLNEPFPLLPELQRLTLEIILRVVFGTDNADLRDRIRGLVGYASSDVIGVRYALRAFGTMRFWRAFARAHARADALIYAEIARQRTNPTGGDDVLSLLLEARHEDGSPMTDQEIRDQLVTLLVAGHETTATGLAWAFDLLTHHPEQMQRLTDEAKTGTEDRYANAVAQETLRLRPPVGVMARTVREPIVVGGYALPPRVRIVPGIAAVNQNAHTYPEPEQFKPERFLDHSPDTYAWIPFGGGIRRCIGASLAQLEMRRALHVILRRATLRAADPEADRPIRRAIIYPPRRGARVILENRA